MARCCGSSGTCSCKIVAGRHVNITGIGTSGDPIVVDARTDLETTDTKTFNLTITGGGTDDNPWVMFVQYADSAELTDLPDVNATTPQNGDVLAWNNSTGQWEAAPPTTAAAGGNLTGSGIEGDGSAGAPLEVTADEARYISVTTSGVGLNEEGINRLVRVFADEAARTAETEGGTDPIPPLVGTLSVLQTRPGSIDYWDGTDWFPITNGIQADAEGQFLELSGPYVDGATPVTQYVRQVTALTDPGGAFTVIPADDLAGYAGVLSVVVQPTGTGASWATVVEPAADNSVYAVAYRLDDGTAYAGYTLTCTVVALLY